MRGSSECTPSEHRTDAGRVDRQGILASLIGDAHYRRPDSGPEPHTSSDAGPVIVSPPWTPTIWSAIEVLRAFEIGRQTARQTRPMHTVSDAHSDPRIALNGLSSELKSTRAGSYHEEHNPS